MTGFASGSSMASEPGISTGTSDASTTVVTLTVAEVQAKLVTLRADRDEWDRLADTYLNYWRLTDEIESYEWLAGGDDA